jgi:hypothetical protein
MKMPALQFYPADWRKDLAVQSLGYFDRGVWFEMLCLMHESSERGVMLLNGAPMPEEVIARLLGLDNQTFNQTLTTILTFGVAKRRQPDNAIFSKRMVDDERLCEIRRQAGKLGGNPALLKQKGTTPDKQIPTPSSSSSSSSSKEQIPHTPQAGQPRKISAIALPTYLDECKAAAEKPIPEDASVFAYASSVGISQEFLRLQWLEFKERYSAPGAKRYKAWPVVFDKSVRGNWFKLWYASSDGGYALTTVGQQAHRRHKEAA